MPRRNIIQDKNKCIDKCDKDDIYKYEYKKGCYEECPIGTSKQNNNNTKVHEYFCKPICTEELPFEDILKQECIKNCPIKDYKEKNCILNYEPKEIGNNIKNEQDEYGTDTKAEDLKLQNFEIGFTSPDYDPTELRDKDEIFEDEKMKIILSTTQNQKNNTNENITLIDLGECEILLRKKNNISDDEILYMKNIEINKSNRYENTKS